MTERPWRVPGAPVRALEAVATAAASGALAGWSWSLLGVAAPAAVVGILNGLISGWRGTYRWRSLGGPVAAVLDSTWAVPMTAASLVAHGVAYLQRDRGGFVADLSRRRNRHVYAGGLRVRKGFAFTLGPVINGATEAAFTSDRRRRLITDHEDVHVWQSRWFGPLYPVLYLGWTMLAGLLGAVVWVTSRREQPFVRVVETMSYYGNPFEWWAYSRDGHWPPSRVVAGVAWRRPVVRPFSATARALGRGRATAPTTRR